MQEACFHSSLACALLVTAQVGVRVDLESGSAGGRADIIVRFGSAAAWVLEVGVTGSIDAKSWHRQRCTARRSLSSLSSAAQ